MERTHPVAAEAAPSWWRSRIGIAGIGFALVGAFYGLREYRGHALGALPYVLILACPLMHLFMHCGHDRHGRGPDTAPGIGARD